MKRTTPQRRLDWMHYLIIGIILAIAWSCGADAHNQQMKEEQIRWHLNYQTQIEAR